MELLIISLNPIPAKFLLIKDSVILFLSVSGNDNDILDSISILSNP